MTTEPPATSVTLVAKQRPVVICDFQFDVAQMHTDQGELSGRDGPARRIMGVLHAQETPVQRATRLARLLSESIAKELATQKILATRELPGSPVPADGLLVTGQFLEVDEGNRLKRAVVGFGTGSGEVVVEVALYDLTQDRHQPIVVYGTGTSAKPKPGAVVSMNPYTLAVKYVLSRNATEKDVRKLGKQIGKQIGKDLIQIEAGGKPTPEL